MRASAELLAGPRRRERSGARFAAAALVGSLASALCLASTAFALAGPSWGRRGKAAERSGLETALVLDVSRSMEVRDGSPTRLDDAKALIRALLRSARAVQAAEPVSFSLVAVKGDAVLLVPMTEDDEALESALDYADPETMDAAGTDLAKGVAAGLASFAGAASANRLLVLLSDGGEASRALRPAAEAAKKAKARLIVLGFGGRQPALVPGPGGPVPDARGQPARSALDEPLLRSFAAAAGGRYLAGADPQTPAALAEEIAAARRGGSRVEFESRDRTGLFAGLSLAFLCCAALAELLAARGRPR